MAPIKIIAMIIALTTLVSCASYRDANTEGYSVINGGFTDQKIMEGLFYIEVQSGTSAISNLNTVEKNWKKRATELCTGEYHEFQYSAVDSQQPYSYNSSSGLGINYYISKAYGYAVCPTYDGNMSEISNLVSGYSTEKEQAFEVSTQFQHQSCVTPIENIEELENAGVVLFKEKSYSKAQEIFLCIYQQDKDQLTQRKSYETLGTMHELGLGVEKDMQQAMFWYQKAGLLPH